MKSDHGVGVGIAMPQTALPAAPKADLVRFAQRSEAAGFDSLWVQEDILSSRGTLDPLSMLALAATATDRIRLGVATLLTPNYNPVHLAKSLASIDVISDGRLTVGVALGSGSARDEAFGVPAGGRVTRFVEGLRVVCDLWTGEPVHFRGAGIMLDGEAMTPVPVQKPRPPIWLGGHSDGALRRAALLGEGFVAGGVTTTDEFAAQVATVRDLRAAAGRDEPYDFAKRVFLAVDNDAPGACRRLNDWLTWFYGDAELAARIGLAGDVATCLEDLRAIIRAGATHVILNFVFDHEEMLEVAASRLLPELRSGDTTREDLT
jgi:alkanesulfonate monooxygenase SsuD/methylene tetrahydromethanopterin reductase-like flavin-dependent oxidoreductase (luciferase family)